MESFIFGGANSAIKIAQESPNGIAKTIAPILTKRVPQMIGNVQYMGSVIVGSQLVPKKNSVLDILMKAGNPS